MRAIPNIQTDATNAPEFITPLAGALLPATPNATFKWTPAARSEPESDGGGAADAGDAGPRRCDERRLRLIFRAATATEDGGLHELLRVMTINTSFTRTNTMGNAPNHGRDRSVRVWNAFRQRQITEARHAPTSSRVLDRAAVSVYWAWFAASSASMSASWPPGPGKYGDFTTCMLRGFTSTLYGKPTEPPV